MFKHLFTLSLILMMACCFAEPFSSGEKLSSEINSILHKPIYKDAKWGLRVVDTTTNQVLIDINSTEKLYIGSIRKIFTMGSLLTEFGPDYRSHTTVHTDGKVRHHELRGNLVLVASADLTMGGRTKADGSIAFTDFDHNEANTLGNAKLTDTDPLAGYKNLAEQVKKAGIDSIHGEVIIDDRLFKPFNFRNEFEISPIFVNDDVIDVMITPTTLHEPADVQIRPQSAAFHLVNRLRMTGENCPYTLRLTPEFPTCFGKANCHAEIKNELPINWKTLTNTYPIIQTVRITKPANYARTVFIEALAAAGVNVEGIKLNKENPSSLLSDKQFYNKHNQVATLASQPYADYAKLVLKVSYNIGADTSLMLLGLSQDLHTIQESLELEEKILTEKYKLPLHSFHFVDGSGGGETMATNQAITDWLTVMTKKPAFNAFYDALPILGMDGSLGFVKNYKSHFSLQHHPGQIRAKTGTYVLPEQGKIIVKGQGIAGYIHSKKGRLLAFHLVVNQVPITGVGDLVGIIEDQGMIAATLWRDF